jgi:hypothetical protein
MTTLEYIDAHRAYLNRLRDLRQREEENLSDVDFRLFSSRFDRLIEKTQTQVDELERMHNRENLTKSFQCVIFEGSLRPGTCSMVFQLKVEPERYVLSGVSGFGELGARIGRVYSDCFETRNVADSILTRVVA